MLIVPWHGVPVAMVPALYPDGYILASALAFGIQRPITVPTRFRAISHHITSHAAVVNLCNMF